MQGANNRNRRRIIIFSGFAFTLVIVLCLSLGTPLRELLPAGRQVQQKTPASRFFPAPTSDNATESDKRMGGQLIQSIGLIPIHPSRLDTLRAEIIPAASDTSHLTYTYAWKVNDRTITNATGDSLDLSNYKKRDLVYVTVTPYDGDRAGFTVKSSVIAVYGISPSLELSTVDRKLKAGGSLVLQLSSIHPETEQVTFSLEPPSIAGMTIDNKTGQITWITQPGQEGIRQFGASVTDTDGTKVTRIFDINVGKPPRPASEN
jgi:hypothetical protein